MAKIIKANNDLDDKKKELVKKINKQTMWLKIGNITLLLLLILTFACFGSKAFAATKSFEQIKQENQQTFEAKKAENESNAEIAREKSETQMAKNKAEFDKNLAASQEKMKTRTSNLLRLVGTVIILMIGSGINTAIRTSKIYKLRNEANKLGAGLDGELNTVQSLAVLSDDYTIICNPKITTNNNFNELDNLIIGPNGIFIIETKNYVGTISGDVKDHDWIQERTVRGKDITKDFYNPIMQVQQHGRRLEEFLRLNSINFKPRQIVYFVNPETTLNIVGQSDVQVFSNQDLDNMLNFINTFNNNVDISNEDKETIVNAIMENQKLAK
jgi:hypothetical protein